MSSESKFRKLNTIREISKLSTSFVNANCKLNIITNVVCQYILEDVGIRIN